MKKALCVVCYLLLVRVAFAESRFGRPVIKVADAKSYRFVKVDNVDYPTLSDDKYDVSCLVYRGREHYYVEVSVTNKTDIPLLMSMGFVSFDKPGYSIYRADTMDVARQAAAVAGVRFAPTPPPYVPPTYHTTLNATATTYGNQTSVYGTSTTTPDYSGQAGANFGNALGNAIAARRFYRAQRIEEAFSQFLASHTQTEADSPIQPGQSRSIVATFNQTTPKKKPFEVTLKVGTETFRFDYKE